MGEDTRQKKTPLIASNFSSGFFQWVVTDDLNQIKLIYKVQFTTTELNYSAVHFVKYREHNQKWKKAQTTNSHVLLYWI